MGYAKEFNPVYQFSSTIANATENFNRTAWRNYSWYLQNHITYNFSLGNQNLSLMAGYESGYYMNEGFIATGTGLLGEDETMHYYNTVTGTVEVQDYNTIQEVASDAFFGRLNWDYKGKYLLTSNIRRDQSSKFGPAMRTGIFPSVSAGWKFSEESFMDGLSWLSFGKIRAGWGKIGNSDIRVYQYYARVINTDVYDYPIDNIASSPGVASHGIANLSLHWEAMKSSNAGIDLTFLSNKISFSFDYFQKENEGMLINRPTPTLVGTHIINAGNEGGETQLVDNVGGVKTKGYETTIGYKTTTGAFEHNFNLNFSQVTNIVGFVGGDTILDGDAIGVSPNFTAEGFPMGVFYGLKTDGLFQESDGILQDDGTWLITNQPFTLDDDGAPIYAQPFAQPGDVRFQDINGDGRVNTEDRAIIGNPHPKHLLGFSYDLRYKLFDFSMFWQGAFGHDIIQVTKFYFYNNSGVYNWEDEIKDRWTPENTDAEIFRLTYLDRNNNDQFSDFYVEPGDYLRLKNIQIGFTMPKTLTSKVNIESFRLYLSVKDAITITKYGGVDPEISTSRNPIAAGIDVSAYPRPIVYTAGINVVF
jgi:TonB-linked SusC/RagA family outer membrane protein